MSNQEIVIAAYQGISPALGVIPGSVFRFSQEADKAEDVLKRVAITDDDTAGRATALIKAIGKTVKECDAERKRYTDPIDALYDAIKAQFDDSSNRLTAVKAAVNGHVTAYLVAKRRREESEAAALRAAQEAIGEPADFTTDNMTVAVNIRSDFGTSAGLRTTVRGMVEDGEVKREFLAWAARNLSTDDLAEISIGQRLLNRVAKKAHEAGKSVPGMTITETEGAVVV